jgi:NAD(P)H-quinone oxidoreductase subunit 5
MTRLLDWLPWLPFGIYALGALFAGTVRTQAWCAVAVATRAALGVAIVGGAISLFASPAVPAFGAALVVTALIAFLGWFIGDYSRRFLRGEPGQARYTVAFLGTLAAVSAVVVSRNLGVLIAAWAASSGGLHHLLTFYRNRPAAVIVAHKKFLASRLAEAMLVVAALLVYREWGTLDISAINLHARSVSGLSWTAGAAAVLIAAAALLKSAQLPLHGWLIQVMEAPTPVSALLHAGVVNIGGYVLIQLGGLIGASPAAQALLVIVGSLTAVLAGVVMLTRVTIKVRLAWSTCSQMGFMMMECGLGLHELALLHLVAHGLYKAYAFLAAGDAVRDALGRQMVSRSSPAARGTTLPRALLALPFAGMIVAGSAWLWHDTVGLPAVPWIAIALLACGLATLLWAPVGTPRTTVRGLLLTAAGAQVYLGWHWLLTERVGPVTNPPSPSLAAFVLLAFGTLYLMQVWLCVRSRAKPPTRLYDWVYAGLYLDERFTRLTFRLWPARIRASDRETADIAFETWSQT